MKNFLKVLVLLAFIIPIVGNSESSVSNDCYTFTRYMSMDVGVNSSDVLALKKILLKENIINNNFNSTVYDENFASAVIDFQMKNGIQKTGTVGPITRAKLNGKYGCSQKNVNNSNLNNRVTTYSPSYSPTYTPSQTVAPTTAPTATTQVVKSIEVLTPTNSNGVNSFEAGNTIKFNWVAKGITGVKKIILISNNSNESIYALNISTYASPITSNSYSWVIPSSVIPGSYQVRIISGDGIVGESLAKIVIRNSSVEQSKKDTVNTSYSPTYTPTATATAKPKAEIIKSITVLTPVNSSNESKFKRGDNINIKWSSTGVRGVSLIKLNSVSNPSKSFKVLDLMSPSSFPLTTDSYSGQIPADIDSGDYKVYVQMGNDNTAVSNSSAGSITILEK